MQPFEIGHGVISHCQFSDVSDCINGSIIRQVVYQTHPMVKHGMIMGGATAMTKEISPAGQKQRRVSILNTPCTVQNPIRGCQGTRKAIVLLSAHGSHFFGHNGACTVLPNEIQSHHSSLHLAPYSSPAL